MIGRLLSLPLLALSFLALPAESTAETVYWIEVDDQIGKPVSDFIERALQKAQESNGHALVIQLDTPGGTVAATKDIVATLLNAEIPVVVFVAPPGSFAASAGTFITMAGHVAAMAPGTSIGAAHPVYDGQPLLPRTPSKGEEDDKDSAPRSIIDEKMENMMVAFIESIAEERQRNVEWAVEAVRNSVAITQKEALELGVIDVIAGDLEELLDVIDGRRIDLGRESMTLATRDADLEQIEMEQWERVYSFITSPAIVALLFLGGMLLLYIEFQMPGMIVPGVLGFVSLVLAGFAMQVLPFDTLGLLLIMAGIGLMISEIFVTSFGVLFALGVLSLGAGVYVLFDVPELTDIPISFVATLLPTVLVFTAGVGLIAFVVARSFRRPQFAGNEGMVGKLAVADSDLSPSGRVFLEGEYWNAEATGSIPQGQRVRVVEVDNLLLRVEQVRDEGEQS